MQLIPFSLAYITHCVPRSQLLRQLELLHISLTAYRVPRSQLLGQLALIHTTHCVPRSQLLRELALLHKHHSLRTAYRVASYLDNLHSYIPLTAYRVPRNQLLRQLALLLISLTAYRVAGYAEFTPSGRVFCSYSER